MLDSGTMPSPRRTWAELTFAPATRVNAMVTLKAIGLRNGILLGFDEGEVAPSHS